jgi:hypothetical protein
MAACDTVFMKSSSDHFHSFALRLWTEEAGSEPEEKIWRGRVTHLTTSRDLYFQDVDDLIEFIQQYLPQFGRRDPS